MLCSIDHATRYAYAKVVTFNTHRLMVRAIEGHDVQIRSSSLQISPAYKMRWIRDVFGNSIALVDFLEPAQELLVKSQLLVEQYNTNPFDFVLEDLAREIPFPYPEEEQPDIVPYLQKRHPEAEDPIREWIRPFLSFRGKTKTLEFLTALTRSVPHYFQYVRREAPGVQSPTETLQKRAGSCRDFALLFMEAARSLGLASRFVSGYLCETGSDRITQASGATHAWAEIYLPGAGWKGFDPTCGILAADLHVRTGAVREPLQAPPISGHYVGLSEDFLGMEVTVDARQQREIKSS